MGITFKPFIYLGAAESKANPFSPDEWDLLIFYQPVDGR
jgi:hypothetical protein